MNILIFLAVLFVTIVLAIFFNRLVRYPLLVGFIFFSITLLVAVILSNLTLVVLAIILGGVAFISAFLDCIFNTSCLFRNNKCIRCHNPYEDTNSNNGNAVNALRIINNDGEVIASISGNTINCHDNDNCCGCNESDVNNLATNNLSCGYRGYKRKLG